MITHKTYPDLTAEEKATIAKMTNKQLVDELSEQAFEAGFVTPRENELKCEILKRMGDYG